MQYRHFGQCIRSTSTQTYPKLFSTRPPPSGGWINDDNLKDLCDSCINLESKRVAPATLPDGSAAPCRICRRVPDCPGFILDENSVLANLRPKMVKEVTKLKSMLEIKVEFENWPAPAFTSFARRLSIVAGAHETHPSWDRFPHSTLVSDVTTPETKNNYRKRKRVYMYPVQGPVDEMAAFHLMRATPSRVGYKSLFLYSSGDVVVAFEPLIMKHTCVFNNVDPSMPSTNGVLKFSSIHVPYSTNPICKLESEMHIISEEKAKREVYWNLPPFDDFKKYAQNRIGTLILNAHSYFTAKASPIQFQPETLHAAKGWILENPGYANHRFWNNPRLTASLCGEVTTDFQKHDQEVAARRKAAAARARQETEEKKKEEKRLAKVYRKRSSKYFN